MPIRRRLFALAVFAFVALHLPGCAAPTARPQVALQCRFDGVEDVTPPEIRRARYDALRAALLGLGPAIDAEEARRVAEVALASSVAQRRIYGVTTSASVHNLKIVNGSKQRGLCIHWTRDLLDRLRALGLEDFTLYWGIANEGNLLTEHSTVVIAARDAAFERGLVLDGWRDSGCLYWSPVTADRYDWKRAARYDLLTAH